jgi:hypothetical protein
MKNAIKIIFAVGMAAAVCAALGSFAAGMGL